MMRRNESGHNAGGRTIDLSPLGECAPYIGGRHIEHVSEKWKAFRAWRVWCAAFVIEEPSEEERSE